MPCVPKARPGEEDSGILVVIPSSSLRQYSAKRPCRKAAGAVRPVEQDALKRLLRKDAYRDVLRAQSGRLQAILNGIAGETAIVLSAGETLLLAGRDQSPIHKQGRISIVTEHASDAKNDFAVRVSDHVCRAMAG